jgi:hypothetical protein
MVRVSFKESPVHFDKLGTCVKAIDWELAKNEIEIPNATASDRTNDMQIFFVRISQQI